QFGWAVRFRGFTLKLGFILDIGRIDVKTKRDDIVEQDSVSQRQQGKVDELHRWPDEPFRNVDVFHAFLDKFVFHMTPMGSFTNAHSCEINYYKWIKHEQSEWSGMV